MGEFKFFESWPIQVGQSVKIFWQRLLLFVETPHIFILVNTVRVWSESYEI